MCENRSISSAAPADTKPADATPDETALVLFSGGQDSTICLAWALSRYRRVETLGFDYGQRHAVELQQRPILRDGLAAIDPDWAARLGPDHRLDVRGGLDAIGGTAMTEDIAIAWRQDGLPNTFVPGRNLLFLIYGAAVAARRGLTRLVGGMCQTDYSGYPDCRRDTLDAQQEAIRLGFGHAIPVETPLMFLDKAQSWVLADALGGDKLTDLIVRESHSCYLGDRSKRHEWGAGCGECPACHLRAQGWHGWQAHRAASLRSEASAS